MRVKKIIIILGCCIITLFSLVFVGCKRNTAKANIISGDYLLELPMLTTTYVGGDADGFEIIIPHIFIGEDNNGLYLYHVSSADGTTFNYVKEYFTQDIYLLYAYNYIDTMSNLSYTYFGALTNLNNGLSNVFESTGNSINYIIDNAVNLNVRLVADTISYEFVDVNNNQVGLFVFENIRSVRGINETFPSFNILLGQFDESDFNTIYIDGYQDGYIKGYNVGVIDGYGATTPFDIVSSTISNLLDIELFGSFKISTLLYIGFGLILLGIVIKVFLGG